MRRSARLSNNSKEKSSNLAAEEATSRDSASESSTRQKKSKKSKENEQGDEHTSKPGKRKVTSKGKGVKGKKKVVETESKNDSESSSSQDEEVSVSSQESEMPSVEQNESSSSSTPSNQVELEGNDEEGTVSHLGTPAPVVEELESSSSSTSPHQQQDIPLSIPSEVPLQVPSDEEESGNAVEMHSVPTESVPALNPIMETEPLTEDHESESNDREEEGESKQNESEATPQQAQTSDPERERELSEGAFESHEKEFDIRVLSVLVSGVRHQIEFDFKSPTAREDVSLAIRSLLGVSLVQSSKRAVFYLKDRRECVYILSHWLLAQCPTKGFEPEFGRCFKVCSAPVQGWPKSGRQALRMVFLVGAINFIVEYLIGLWSPFQMPKLAFFEMQESIERSASNIFALIYFPCWAVTSSLFARIPAILHYARLWYPRKLRRNANDLYATASSSQRRRAVRQHSKKTIVNSQYFSARLRNFLACCRTGILNAAPGALFWTVLCKALREYELETETLNLALATGIVLLHLICIFLCVKQESRLYRLPPIDSPPFEISVYTFEGRKACLSWKFGHSDAPPFFEIEYRTKSNLEWSPEPYCRLQKPERPRYEWIQNNCMVWILVALVVPPELLSVPLGLAIFALLNLLFDFLPHNLGAAQNGSWHSMVLGLEPGQEYQWRVWNVDASGNRGAQAVSCFVECSEDPNLLSLIYEDDKIYRVGTICWGALKSTRPLLKNEAAEIDSFMDTIRSSMADSEICPRTEDDPDILVALPKHSTTVVVLSRSLVSDIHRGNFDRTLRLRAPGTRVHSYNLWNEIWRQCTILGVPPSISVVVVVFSHSLLILQDGLKFHHFIYVLHLVGHANASFLLVSLARLVLQLRH